MIITPLHDTHAIESVSFGVEWTQALPPAVMATLESVYEATIQSELPSKRPVQQLAVEFNPDGGNAVRSAQAVGWTFERFAPDGRPARSLMLTPTTLAVTLHAYTRWEDAYASATELMRPFLPLIAVSTGGFSVLGLQYMDAFRITGEAQAFRADMLLRRNSDFLPASVFERSSLWHAHHGYFTELHDQSPAKRRLTVVNTDLIDEGQSRTLRILTMHRTMFDPPLADVEQLYAGDDTQVHAAMHKMHDENKHVLRSLLNDAMVQRVGLSITEETSS